MNFRGFFAELKRRNVYKVAIAYGVVAWLLMQIASQIFPFFETVAGQPRRKAFFFVGGGQATPTGRGGPVRGPPYLLSEYENFL